MLTHGEIIGFAYGEIEAFGFGEIENSVFGKLPTAAAISPERSEDFTREADFTHP